MMTLNNFLRKCLREKIDFRKIKFVRNQQFDNWDRYFPKGVERTFCPQTVDPGAMRFNVQEVPLTWACRPRLPDLELISVTRYNGGIRVVLGGEG